MKKPIYKRWWFYVIVVIVLFGAVGAVVDDDSATEQVSESSNEKDTESTKARTDKPDKDEDGAEEVEDDSKEDIIERCDSEIVVAAKMALDRYISNYDISLAPQRWTLAKFDDENAVIGMTEISWKDEKYNYVYVGTLNFNDESKVESATPHFLAIGNRVLGDDGYCDDVFSTLEQIFENN